VLCSAKKLLIHPCCSWSVLIAFQPLLNFPNTTNMVQLFGLAPSASVCDSQALPADLLNAAASSSSDLVNAESVSLSTSPTSMHESPTPLDSAPPPPPSLDVVNTSSIFCEASKSVLRPMIHDEAGASGDSSLMKGPDAGSTGSLYQTTAGLPHVGGGDDLGMSQVAVLSNQTEAQLQELFRQQQWHVRLNQMMQLDVMQPHQSQTPVIIGADTAASLLWHHQQQQQHAAAVPTTVSFAFCNDQMTQQQQQVLLQQQQQQQAQTSVEMKYEMPQQHQLQTKATSDGSQHTQSPRQQKPRLIARGRSAYQVCGAVFRSLSGSN